MHRSGHSVSHLSARTVALLLPGAVVALSIVVLPAQVATAMTDTVTNCAGSGPGSLPAVVVGASSGDTVSFDVDCSLIDLNSTIDINVGLTIDGPGENVLSVNGQNTNVVFEVGAGDFVTISGLHIENGNTGGGTDGNIYNNSGILTVLDCTISGGSPGILNTSGGDLTTVNSVYRANVGSGIENDGSASVLDSTFEDNNAGSGAGIFNVSTIRTALLSVTGSTFTENIGNYGSAIYNTGNATLTTSTLIGNTANSGGGAVVNAAGMTISDSIISGNALLNSSTNGGGISNYANLELSDVTVSGNTAPGLGGGIFVEYGTSMDPVGTQIVDSTIAGNSAAEGGGIDNDSSGGTIELGGTIVADNKDVDCSGAVTDAGYNDDDDGSCGFSSANHSLSDVDPYLGPLANNGGPTQTQAPAMGSPVLDQIPVGTTVNGTTLCPGTDQRGVPRPQGSECDIGAVELAVVNGIDGPTAATATVGSPFTFTITTAGLPVPTISETGALPKGVRFKAGTNGTATLSGTPTKTGVAHLTIVAKFPGTAKYTASEVVTLTVATG